MRHYTYEEIKEGQKETFSVVVTEKMLEAFGNITGDHNPLHCHAEYAQEKGYKNKVAYGMLTASFLSTLAGEFLPGERSLIHRVEVEFPRPVYVGETLSIEGIVQAKNDLFHTLELKVSIRNQENEKVLRGKMRVQVL